MAILTNTENFVGPDIGWQQHLKLAIRDVDQLLELLELPANLACQKQANGPFPVFAPLPFVSRIERGNPNDPLLRQLLPTPDENLEVPGFVADPLHEAGVQLETGILHKYSNRALLVVNGTCGIHCRYCFRREYPYSGNSLTQDWTTAVERIAGNEAIEEVLLSGGDPLTWVDSKLGDLITALNDISHLKRIRIHSRMPIVIPQRVTDGLLDVLNSSNSPIVMVLHCNHANEIDAEVVEICRQLINHRIVLLNQAVLLRGINDSVDSQIHLSERLVEAGVVPYYLHQLDSVRGASHFRVPQNVGVQLIQEMRKRVSGYLVPKFVQEIPGEPHKTPLA